MKKSKDVNQAELEGETNSPPPVASTSSATGVSVPPVNVAPKTVTTPKTVTAAEPVKVDSTKKNIMPSVNQINVKFCDYGMKDKVCSKCGSKKVTNINRQIQCAINTPDGCPFINKNPTN